MVDTDLLVCLLVCFFTLYTVWSKPNEMSISVDLHLTSHCFHEGRNQLLNFLWLCSDSQVQVRSKQRPWSRSTEQLVLAPCSLLHSPKLVRLTPLHLVKRSIKKFISYEVLTHRFGCWEITGEIGVYLPLSVKQRYLC